MAAWLAKESRRSMSAATKACGVRVRALRTPTSRSRPPGPPPPRPPARARPGAEAEPAALGDGKPRRAVGHEPARRAHDRGQDVLERAGGSEAVADSGQRLEPPALLLHLGQEERALDDLADLVGDGLEDLDLLGQE